MKKSLIAQSVTWAEIHSGMANTYLPQPGDVGVFEVVRLGKHQKIQTADGKLRHIFPGDILLAAFGNRYATGQFEGYVPEKIYPFYDILGQGGAVGVVRSSHARLEKVGPTQVRLLGYAVDANGQVVNTRYFQRTPQKFRPGTWLPFKVILSIGSSMDSGKTTTAGYLAKGLTAMHEKVGYLKLTGTVYSKDKDFVFDCGAHISIDFSDFGFPSTYLCPLEELLDLYATATASLGKETLSTLIIEVADGVFQQETHQLLHCPEFMQTVDHIFLSCSDSLSVLTGIDFLFQTSGRAVTALSGLFTASPLLVEEVKRKTSVPIMTLEDLQQANRLFPLLNTPTMEMVG